MRRSGKRDYGNLVEEGLAYPKILAWLKERDQKWGPVESFSIESASGQLGGKPSWVNVQVWRKRRNVRETFAVMGKKVFSASPLWPAGEAK